MSAISSKSVKSSNHGRLLQFALITLTVGFVLCIVHGMAYAKETDYKATVLTTQASTQQYSSADFNGDKYWVVFHEGFRDGRLEATSFNISSGSPYLYWNSNLTVRNATLSGRCNQYYYNDKGEWEKIGEYGIPTDWALDIVSSNMNVIDSEGNLAFDAGGTAGLSLNVSNATVSNVKSFPYTGKRIAQKPVVKVQGRILKSGIDYSLSYKNNTNPGAAYMTITGKGSCTGAKMVKFTIAKANASGFTVATPAKQKYTGKLVEPKPRVSFNGRRLTLGKDYSLSYSNNKKCGKATIKIKGKGKFTGTKKATFQIVKPNTLTLSKSSITLNLVNSRSATLKATKNFLPGTVKWKSSNKGVVAVDKAGKLTAKAKGAATVTAYVGKVKKTCKVTVEDIATKTVTFDSFKDYDSWNKAVQLAERNLVGLSGNIVTLADGKTYYTGNIIVERKILEHKTVDIRVNDIVGPVQDKNYTNKTVHLRLPSKVQYKLHRHNLSNKVNSKNVGRLMAGLVEQKLVWTQECGCGLECVLSWDIPLPDNDENFDGDTTIQANSVMKVQHPAK